MVSQLRRAIISVLLNLAEGSNRHAKKDFKKFVRYSISSLIESDCALKVAIDLKFIQQEDYDKLDSTIKELYFKLIGLDKFLAK